MASIYKRRGSKRWQIKWVDEHGRARQRSSRVTDKALAKRKADEIQRAVDLRRMGVVTPEHDQQIRANKQTIASHIEDYVADGAERGHSVRHLHQKRVHLASFVEGHSIHRLLDVTPECVKAHLRDLEQQGLSGRSRAIRRSTIRAFLNWCVQQGRLGANPITNASVPKPDETPQQKRRPLTADELHRLLSVAEDGGRKAWYACAAIAGLRKSDLQRLRWCDIDFEGNLITIFDGKRQRKARSAGREVRPDVIPLHPELAVILRTHRARAMALPQGPVFPTTVTDATRRRDFVRAGLARWIEHRDLDGKLVRKRYDATDERGQVVDLHALRATLASNLAKAGVPMAFTQQILRHEDARTTQRHYISVSQEDAAKALGALKFDVG